MKGDLAMNVKSVTPVRWLCLVCLALTSCATKAIPTQPPQPPEEYLSKALDWIETNSVKIDTADWEKIRARAVALPL